jgi:hypothetical protein
MTTSDVTVILGGINTFYPNYQMVSTGTVNAQVERTYSTGVRSTICAHKCQSRQDTVLSRDKIVPAECLAGCGAGTDTDLEVKCPGQARSRNWLQPVTGCTGSSDHTEMIGIDC